MSTLLYYLGISLLLTHEMDAVAHAEWRLLFVLRDMSDQAAYPVFIALHIPLIFLFFWLGHSSKHTVRGVFRAIAAVFLIMHALIHFSLSNAPEYTFHGVLSNALIYGAALCGIAYLAVLFLERSSDANQ
ncbi:MAG: DUF6713 family protein [Pseudomonadota bacterium]